jgi:hypothetical protein
MRKQLARTILATGTIAAAMGLAVPAAMAAGTWTVTGGTSFTATASSGTTFTLTDTTANLSFTCTVGTGSGTVTDESSGTNTAIGSITASTFGSSSKKCSGPLGSTGTDTQVSGTTSTLNVSSYSGGVTTGTITNIDHVMTISSILGTCTATVKGTAGITYTNKTDLLQFTTAGDSLKVTGTSGSCAGIVKTNDVVTFSSGSGGETVTGSPVNPIQVSQP